MTTLNWEVFPPSGVPKRLFCSNPECVLHVRVSELESVVRVSDEKTIWGIGHTVVQNKRFGWHRKETVCDLCAWQIKCEIAASTGKKKPQFKPSGGWHSVNAKYADGGYA